MTDVFRRIAAATANADVQELAALAMELAAQVAGLEQLREADESRRSRQADRTRRHRNKESRAVTLQSVTEGDVSAPLPPAPSLLPPTPPNNPSSPPIPASAASAPAAGSAEADAEARLLQRFDDSADRAGVERFLGYATDAVKRMAWCGRLGALLDKPPHFTPPELAEGLEALLTQAVGTWGPALLKVWVTRVRADAARAVLAEAEAATGVRPRVVAPGAEATAAWEFVSGELLRKHIQRTITMEDLAALGPRSRAALRSIGGLPALSQLDQKQLPFARRDFIAAFRRNDDQHLDGAAA